MIPVNALLANVFRLVMAGSLGAQAPDPTASAPSSPRPTTVSPDPGLKGKPVFISEGKIPLRDFLKVLSNYTGLPVLHNSSDSTIENQEIHLINDIPEATEEVVKTILEINGIRIYTQELSDGKRVMKVEPIQGNSLEDPSVHPIIIDPGESPRPLRDRGKPPAPTAVKETDLDRRLRELEAKVEEIRKSLDLRTAVPDPSPDPLMPKSGRPHQGVIKELTRREQDQMDALNRKFEERYLALKKEHQEAIGKLMREFSDPPAAGRQPKG